MKRYWDEYTTHDLARLPRQSLVAVLPLASVAQHGPHLPLSTDRTILEGLVAAVVKRLPETLPALFLPVQAIAKSVEHIRYPGTLALSAETLLALLKEVGGSLAAAGVRRMMVLNAHEGNAPVVDIAARALRISHNMIVVGANPFALDPPEGLLSDDERRHGRHGGQLETSLMLALRPDLVRIERARDFESLTERLERNFAYLGSERVARLGWQAQDLNPAGAVGDATAATAEIGEAALASAAAAVAALIDDVARFPVGLLHNPTEI